MSARSCLNLILSVCLIVPVVGCGSAEVDSIAVSPTSQALVVGQSVQLTAVGTYGHGPSHPAAQHDVTALAKWASSNTSVATVSTSGLVTSVGDGTTTITASMNGFTGVVSGSSAITVVSPSGSGGGSVSGLLSLSIIPSAITVGDLQDTGQFLAIGTFATSPTVRDLTNSVNWISDAPNIFPISTNGTGVPSSGTNAGVVTAYGHGTGLIIAEATDPKSGSIETATATFNCPLTLPTYDSTGKVTNPGSCYFTAPSLLATLTIYSAGLNSTDWMVAASSATGTPNVIHCGPGSNAAGLGAPVCTATYPLNPDPLNPGYPDPNNPTKVLLKATGTNFGGWSYNCIPSDANGNALPAGSTLWTAAGPNYCYVDLTTNDTVGAIFN
jgi:hypothetical protein